MLLPYQFLILCLLLSVSCNSPATQKPHWHSSAYIEKSFYDIALKNEYDNKPTRIRKWTKPLKVFISHQVGDRDLHLRILKMHLSQINKITRLPIQYVNKKSLANLTIFITRSNQVNNIIRSEISPQAVKQLRNAVCLANIRQNNRSEITKAMVIIPVDRARMHGKLISCFVEELTQILGLPNDSKTVHPTIFSDKNIYKLLTGLDFLFLKLLYSSKVKAGMTKTEVKPIIKKLLHKWQLNGMVANAQKEVIKGDLYELLGYR
ncbi:MAG: DUF2927 domain-containing protein [gamma proteobacterium symbiont of Taylorina sp.]|nr:DUF2927 domain-containing protein [gamma proteobacterium symbiont of Taylorina sp.]